MAFLDTTPEEIENLSDTEVLARSIENENLFSIIVSRYEDPFRRKVRRILGDREEIDDVLQEAFTKIYVNAHRFKKQEGAQFSSWAYKILINTTFTQYQKLKKGGAQGVRLDDEIWNLIPDKAREGERETGELQDLIASVLSRMPEPLAKILTLHFIDDMPQRDIAKAENISVAAVKTRVHRAKKEFKKIVDTRSE